LKGVKPTDILFILVSDIKNKRCTNFLGGSQ